VKTRPEWMDLHRWAAGKGGAAKGSSTVFPTNREKRVGEYSSKRGNDVKGSKKGNRLDGARLTIIQEGSQEGAGGEKKEPGEKYSRSRKARELRAWDNRQMRRKLLNVGGVFAFRSDKSMRE